MKPFILSLVALLFFVFDSVFSQLFAGHFFGKENIVVPYFMMIFVLLLTVYGSRKYGMMYGAILGLGYDVVYTEILGVYMFLLPFLAYVLAKCMKVLQSNWMIVMVLLFLFVGIAEVILYELNVLMSFATFHFSVFAERRLLPTALLNSVFILFFFYPLQKFIRHFTPQGEVE